MQHSFVTTRALSTLKTSPKARTSFRGRISPSQSKRSPSLPSSHRTRLSEELRGAAIAPLAQQIPSSPCPPHIPLRQKGRRLETSFLCRGQCDGNSPGGAGAAAGAARGPGFRPLSGLDEPGQLQPPTAEPKPPPRPKGAAPNPNPLPHPGLQLQLRAPQGPGSIRNPPAAVGTPRSPLGLGNQGHHNTTKATTKPETGGIFHCTGKARTPSWQKTISPGPALRVKRSPRGAGPALNPYFLLQMGGARVQLLQLTSAAGKPCKDPRKPGLLRTLLTAAEQGRVAGAEPLKVTNPSPNLGLPLKSVPVLAFASHFRGLREGKLSLAALLHDRGGDRSCFSLKTPQNHTHCKGLRCF